MTKKIWDQHAIKAEMHRQGMTLTRLAEIERLNPKTFRSVWARTNRKAEAAIAKFLKVPVEELFPTRYPIRSSRILSSKYEAGGASPNAMRDAA